MFAFVLSHPKIRMSLYILATTNPYATFTNENWRAQSYNCLHKHLTAKLAFLLPILRAGLEPISDKFDSDKIETDTKINNVWRHIFNPK